MENLYMARTVSKMSPNPKGVLLLLAVVVVVSFNALMPLVTANSSSPPPPCDSKIYCVGGQGSLLHTVQMAGIYKDSKTFVDMPLARSQADVLANFDKMMQESSKQPSTKVVEEFVLNNFLLPGSEFEDFSPEDWKEHIPLFDKLKDSEYLDMAKFIHKRWKELGRQIKLDVGNNPDRYSLIYMEKPFVVPGGRFREVYYWDSYWTILGLLVSEMHSTVKGMLENFSKLIDQYGFIPNGNRIYYTRRSQPPLFISMVEEYVKATNDQDFIKDHITAMEKEFLFWMRERTTQVSKGGKNYTLARYNVEVYMPRPESYKEDYTEAETFFEEEKEKREFYMNMKSGAESGWDYSTKWFMGENGEVTQELKDNKARHIAPVELNSYLCRNARVLSNFFTLLQQEEKAKEYEDRRKLFETSINDVMWNEESGTWFDYDLINGKQRELYLISNFAPLWADCYGDTNFGQKTRKVLSYIVGWPNSYIGGIPTSRLDSGQQWDFGNSWPPMQELVATGLENTELREGKEVARDVVNKYLQTMLCTFTHYNHIIFEKYDVTERCKPGAGGEYGVQEGFGWTNGVAMHFLNKYGDMITSVESSTSLYVKPTLFFVPSLLFVLLNFQLHAALNYY